VDFHNEELSILLLGRLLKDLNVDQSKWGISPQKSVEDLFREIQKGESFLRVDSRGIHRVIRVVIMRIMDGELGTLFEDYQMYTGVKRRIGRIPAEK
jgi:hypothetical protein